MILLIDNYDSFSYNLYQLFGTFEPDIKVIRNDEMTAEDIADLSPQAIVLSPGPGRPQDSGVCMSVARQLGPYIPVLGVCLGHQAICTVFGGTVSYARELMHGKQSVVYTQGNSPLFAGLEKSFPAGRYHSLEAVALPRDLRCIAQTENGEIMAVEHTRYPVYGLQFHPESILTPCGPRIVENFLRIGGIIK